MPTNSQLRKFIVPVIVIFLALVLFVTSVSPAFAGTPEPAKPLPGLGKISNDELRSMLLRERAWYDSQSKIIRDANELAGLAQGYIDAMKTKGRDVTGLESALTEFYNEIAAAQIGRAKSAKILGNNGGFNGYFNVINRPLAGRTVLEARKVPQGHTHPPLAGCKESASRLPCLA